jgi:hypothetical protein
VERWGEDAGLARAGAEKGWRRSDLATPDLGVGCDNGWKAAGLARVGPGEGWRHLDLIAPGLTAMDRGAGHDNEWRRGKGWSATQPGRDTGGGAHAAQAEARRVPPGGFFYIFNPF